MYKYCFQLNGKYECNLSIHKQIFIYIYIQNTYTVQYSIHKENNNLDDLMRQKNPNRTAFWHHK